MAKFNLNDYIYDDRSLYAFRRKVSHIHSVIRPDQSDVSVGDFKYDEESDRVSYWVEHWEDKLTCDYCERFAIPSSFVSNNLSDEEIKRQWLKLHPEETEEVAINGIPKVNWDVSGKNTRTVIRYHVIPASPGCSSKDCDGLEFTYDGGIVDAVNAWVDYNRIRIMNNEVPMMESFFEDEK